MKSKHKLFKYILLSKLYKIQEILSIETYKINLGALELIRNKVYFTHIDVAIKINYNLKDGTEIRRRFLINYISQAILE
jgi:hypothetical protein